MTMMAAFDSVDLACSAVSAIIADGIVPATLELMDRKMMEILEDYTHAGLPVEAGAALIIEVDGHQAGLQPQIDRITSIIARFNAFGLRCTQDEEERAAIWLARKSVAGALARLAPASLAVDPTVPRSLLGEALRRMAKICEERKVPTYYVSHAGDGNLHPQILIADADDEKLMDHILETGRLIMQEAVRLGGTISGEHGVGVEKRELMNFIYRPDELAAMREIKAVFDPEEQFNPGKVFPTTAPEPDLMPQRRILPAVQDIADRIRAAAESSPPGRVVIVGTPAPESPASAAEICLSSRALDGVLSFVADDMYVVAGAGTRLANLAGFLETKNRILPLVSPWEETTLGGLVAANLNGPLRARYGGIKDLLLSMEVVLPDGRVVEAGRPLVKNVAGYDLPRLFVGSFGSLGMITSVTFKVLAPPKARFTCAIPVADPGEAIRVGLALYRQAITASAILWIRENAASQGSLICTFEGQPEEIEIEKELLNRLAAASRLTAAAPVPGEDGSSLWAAWVRSACQNGPLTKYGVAPGDLPVLLSDLAGKSASGTVLIDIANGCLYLDGDDDARLAALALERGGYAMDISKTPPDRDRIFKDQSGTRLLSALKQRWDPSGSFNPDGPLL
jgi:D-lactate dehydrogenase (cytochrome)